mgnify:CR=1 FL=1
MAIVEVNQVQVTFGEKTAVSAASFSIEKGETFSLIGESGCGKSTILRVLAGLQREWRGSIALLGEALTPGRRFEGELRRNVQMVFQDPWASLHPNHTISRTLSEPLNIRGETQVAEKVANALHEVGLSADAGRRYPHQLSGGMSQRVMIAMAIACRPKLLIADEPTTALDVTIQAQIIELLLELQQKENMALVLITHDLALVAEAAHKIIVMYAGQVVETGNSHDIFRAPRHPYTQALLRALPEFAQDKARLASLPGVVPGKYDRPQGCLLNPRCPYATDKCRTEEPELNQLADGRQSKCHYPLDDAGRPTL